MFDLIRYNFKIFAGVVELVDTLDLGSSVARRESSSLSLRTIYLYKELLGALFHNIPDYIQFAFTWLVKIF